MTSRRNPKSIKNLGKSTFAPNVDPWLPLWISNDPPGPQTRASRYQDHIKNYHHVPLNCQVITPYGPCNFAIVKTSISEWGPAAEGEAHWIYRERYTQMLHICVLRISLQIFVFCS